MKKRVRREWRKRGGGKKCALLSSPSHALTHAHTRERARGIKSHKKVEDPFFFFIFLENFHLCVHHI